MKKADKLERREIVKLGGTGLLLAGLDPKTLFALPEEEAASPFIEQLTSTEFLFPYDATYFDAAERISNLRRSVSDPSVWLTDLNLLVKNGKTLDIKVLVADRSENLGITTDVQSFAGVKDSLDLQIRGYDSPRLYYQVQYRAGQGDWKALPPRNFKLPIPLLILIAPKLTYSRPLCNISLINANRTYDVNDFMNFVSSVLIFSVPLG